MTSRVGLIIPSSNRMVEQEMVPAFPHGVTAHVTRLRMTGANRLAFEELLPRI
jgi:maleate cis-trans isomerase